MVCSGSSPFWTVTHDAIVQVLKAMLVSAGFVDVKEEDRWWDPDAPLGARKKRPDVTAIHPKTHVRWIFDVTVAWSLKGDPATAPLASSEAAAARKWSDYVYLQLYSLQATATGVGCRILPTHRPHMVDLS